MSTYSLPNSTGKAVKLGAVKIILRCLAAMGQVHHSNVLLPFLTELPYSYQFRFNILNAGAYGAPQSRNRLIIMASQQGCPLPKVPTPSHAFPSRSVSIDLTDGSRIVTVNNQDAPHPPVTVQDAIGDLPSFDW